MTEPRKGQAPGQISRAEFSDRYQAAFRDPAFAGEKEAIARIEQIAWLACKDAQMRRGGTMAACLRERCP